MTLRWVLFDLNGTLLDPACLALPLGDAPADRALVQRSFNAAIQLAMAATLAGCTYQPLDRYLAQTLERELRADGRPTDQLGAMLEQARTMRPFADASAALDVLLSAHLHLGVLTNSTTKAATTALEAGGLSARFEVVLGSDEVGVFKPHPEVYRRALARLGVQPNEVCLVAAHAWDLLGAGRQGLRTAWAGHQEHWLVPLIPPPHVRGQTLLEVARALVCGREADGVG